MADTDTRPVPQSAAGPETGDAHLPMGTKSCAVGAGVIGAVCCGGGLAAVMATSVGAIGAATFMRTWANMQGITLISSAVAVLAVFGLALLTTRRARAGLALADRRRVYRRALVRLTVWALAGYFAWVIIAGSVLALIGFDYPKG